MSSASALCRVTWPMGARLGGEKGGVSLGPAYRKASCGRSGRERLCSQLSKHLGGNKLTKITVDMNDGIKLLHFIFPYIASPKTAFLAAIMFNCCKNSGTLYSFNSQESCPSLLLPFSSSKGEKEREKLKTPGKHTRLIHSLSTKLQRRRAR